MKKDDLLKGVGNIDPKYVEEAEKSMAKAVAKKSEKKAVMASRLRWGLATAACIGLAVVFVFVLNPINKKDPSGNNNNNNVAKNTDAPTPTSAAVAAVTPKPVPTLFIDPVNLPTGTPLIRIPTKAPEQPVGPTQPIKFTAEVASLSDGYVRKSTDTGNLTAEMQKVISNFAWKLLKEDIQLSDGGNRMVSPYSALAALALTANGMQGESLAQLEKYLGTDILSLNRGLYAYADFLKSVGSSRFNIANSIWTDNTEDRLTVNPDFLQTNADWYDSQVYSAKLADPETVKAINDWCDKSTNGMIPKLLDSLSADAAMVLINAIAFEAEWLETYSAESIIRGRFTNADGTRSSVEFLSSDEKCILYDDANEPVGFVKEYAGGRYSFVGLLPAEGQSAYQFVKYISGETWLRMWNGRKTVNMKVLLPEFKCESESDIKNIMAQAGVTAMFGGEGFTDTDFEPLGTSTNGPLFVSDIFQKTFIDVNRYGTKAAAATGVIVADMIAVREKLVFDHPFAYAIVDNVTGLPVFLGVVNNL